MGKRHRKQDSESLTNALTRDGAVGKTDGFRDGDSRRASASDFALPTPTPFWRMVFLPTLAAAALVASVWFYTRPVESSPRPKPNPGRMAWNPTTEEDHLVEAFTTARNKDMKATTNLAPDPTFDDKPVSEAEGDAKQSHHLLHRAKKIIAIHAGEPGEDKNWLNTPHRYTLTTRLEGSTPKVAVQVGNRVATPSSLFIINPDIIVEVRDGKIHALRAELPWK